MRKKICISNMLLLVACLPATMVSAQPITVETLLEEMRDLKRLASFPSPPYQTRQFSSYDRRSTDPGEATEENWFANGDRGHFLRTETRNGETEYVLMDAPGPGTIVRIWSANPIDAGLLRIYLDHQADPTVEMPLAHFLSGESDLSPPPLSGERGKGWNAYLPIPYGQHCKITASQPDFYYHINYRTYATGTEVETFTRARSDAAKALRQSVAEALAAPLAYTPPYLAEATETSFIGEIRPGEEMLALLADGPSALAQLTCRVDTEQVEKVLRGAILRIYFDGEKTARVDAPLGDFFGTAPGLNPYTALPGGVREDHTLISRWYMPFRKDVAVVVTNTTKTTLQLDIAAQVVPHTWGKDSLYFHAKWRAGRDIKTRPFQDWNFAALQGRGRYVGNMLHISNPVLGWWGEGDEKIYVDGETFPSHFGTGTEDYYGYAWSDTAVFSHAYHNQPRSDGPANYGHSCVSRFHILDDIPFNTAFRFDMEVWHWEDCVVDQSAITYWYGDAAGTDNFAPLTPPALTIPMIAPPPEPRRVAGAREGEALSIVETSGGETTIQHNPAWNWSNGSQLWWRDGAPGDRLSVAFPVDTPGVYEVRGVFTRAIDYGTVQILINGAVVQEKIDFYQDGVTVPPEISLATLELPAGEQQLTLVLTGKNEKAQPAYMAGIDYLRLRPAAHTLEGEALALHASTGGTLSVEDSLAYGWSGNRQALWAGAQPGDTLEFLFDAPAAGSYQLNAVFTFAPGNGIFDFAVNGKPLTSGVDLYGPDVVCGSKQDLGAVTLLKDKNTFTVTLVGTNEKADRVEYRLGLDYLQFAPVE